VKDSYGFCKPGLQFSCDSAVKHCIKEQSQISLLPAELVQKTPFLSNSQALPITGCTRAEGMPRGLQAVVKTRPHTSRSAVFLGIILIRLKA